MVIKNGLIVIGSMFAAACVSSGTKVTGDQAAAFQNGTATEAQVTAALGAPNRVSTLSDGSRIDVYAHVQASANGASYVPVVALFAGGVKSTTDEVTFNFNPQGILTSTSSSRSQTNTNTGIANQK